MCTTVRSQMCAHAKDPISVCRKRAGLTAQWYGSTETPHRGEENKSDLGSCTLAAYFPRAKKPQIFCALHWDKKSNLV